MVKAKVSLQSVTNLQQKADAEIEPVESLRKSTDCISEITQCIAEEVDKILAIFPECQDALEIGQDKLQKLQEELKVLEAKLACTPKTTTESVPDGVDAEGNTRYTTRTVPNPDYIALEQEIAELEGKINHLDGLISELDQHVQTLEETRERFERAQTTFLSNQKTINSTCTSLIQKSEHASEQLKRAEEAIQNYLDEQVQLKTVPSHTSIVWNSTSQSYPPTEGNEDKHFWGTWNDYLDRGEIVSTSEFREHDPELVGPGEYAVIGGVYFTKHAINRMWPSQYTNHLFGDNPGEGHETQKQLPPEYRAHMRVESGVGLTYEVKNETTGETRYIKKGEKLQAGEKYVLNNDNGRGIPPTYVLTILNSCTEIDAPSDLEKTLGGEGNPVFFKKKTSKDPYEHIYIDDQIMVATIKKNGKIAVKTVIYKSEGWKAKDIDKYL